LLGLASLLNDVSSEAAFPLLGPFLTTLGAPMQFVGLAMGAADTLGVAVRILVGRASDRWRRRPLVVGGYLLPAAARALLSVAVHPWHVLVARTLDRGGKAIRSGPRDAMLADAVDARDRGRAYGVTQALDHVGAAIGPLIASLCLARGLSFRATFALAASLGVLAPLLLAFRLPEVPRERPNAGAGSEPLPAGAGRPLAAYLVAAGLFAFANSSDAFILIRAGQLGWAPATLPLLWLGHHVIKAITTAVGGTLSDRVPRWILIAGGWLAYAAVYWGFSLVTRPAHLALLLGAYALYHGLAEGPERAFISDLVGTGKRGAAFGLYHGVVGGVALPAGLLMGWVWDRWGAGPAFRVEALFALVAVATLLALIAGPLRSRARFPAHLAKRR
jgi:MFS family permease